MIIAIDNYVILLYNKSLAKHLVMHAMHLLWFLYLVLFSGLIHRHSIIQIHAYHANHHLKSISGITDKVIDKAVIYPCNVQGECSAARAGTTPTVRRWCPRRSAAATDCACVGTASGRLPTPSVGRTSVCTNHAQSTPTAR